MPVEGVGQPEPKSTGSKNLAFSYKQGVLVAKREGYSFMSNSVGPLWILEVNDPDSPDHGKIIRCFERLPDHVTVGNTDDGATPLWFRIEKMTRPDGAKIEVATHIGLEKPADADKKKGAKGLF